MRQAWELIRKIEADEKKLLCKECYNGNYHWTTWSAERCPTCGKSRTEHERKGSFEFGRKAMRGEN